MARESSRWTLHAVLHTIQSSHRRPEGEICVNLDKINSSGGGSKTPFEIQRKNMFCYRARYDAFVYFFFSFSNYSTNK